MSTLTQPGELPVRARAWRALLFVTAAVVLALSVAEFVNLLNRHMVGAETYGLLVAGLAVAAGILSLGLILADRRRLIATTAVLVLWAIVAIGGLAGAYYHAAGVDPKYSAVDPRPRPVAAPLIFTAIGIVGAAALVAAQRAAGNHD